MSPLLLLVVAAAIIFATELLKSWGVVEDSVWYIPTACIVGTAGLIGYEILANSPLTILATLNSAILGIVLGSAGGGLYALVQKIRGDKK